MLYSGIILFEMFYKPLDTKMERIKVLGYLRTTDIVIPEDFPMKKTDNKPRDLCKVFFKVTEGAEGPSLA